MAVSLGSRLREAPDATGHARRCRGAPASGRGARRDRDRGGRNSRSARTRLARLCVSLALTLVAASAWAPGQASAWTLAFRDEFNDTALDSTKWDTKYPRSGDMVYSNWTNGEAQWYKRANISEGGGSLRLTAKREKTTSPYSGRTFNYTSGLVHSKPAFNFRYGKMAARMKLPKGSGFWPAFWTWPSNEQWPPETDAMEFYGDNARLIYQTYHGHNGANGSSVRHTDWTAGWHTFTVDWQPGRLTWYVDGLATKTVTEAPSLNMYLIANLAIANGARAPAPNASTRFPSSLKIDYIRVWKR
jgi:beta-glucanase (GH16 family)